MNGSALILIELLLVFALVFGLGWRELRKLKRLREAREREARQADEKPD